MADKITFTLDGKEVSAEPNQRREFNVQDIPLFKSGIGKKLGSSSSSGLGSLHSYNYECACLGACECAIEEEEDVEMC